MTIEAREAAYLCTGSEYRLYQESCEPWIRQFRGDSIRESARRAVKLCALWRARADAVRRATATIEKPAEKTAQELAVRKTELFGQIADRYHVRLHSLSEILRTGRATTVNAASGVSTDFGNV